jgi:hypothetical protein
MPDDLDLHVLDRRHEPDPAFRAALRSRVLDVLTTTDHYDTQGEITMLVEEDRTEEARGPGDTGSRRSGRSRRPLLWGAAAAAVALVAGAVVLQDDGDAPLDLADATPVYEDGFDAAGTWPKQPVPGVEITTGGGQQVLSMGRGTVQIVRAPGFEPFRDMVVALDVVSVGQGATVGVQCRKNPVNGEGNFYSFRLGPRGAELAFNGGGRTELLASEPSAALPAGPFTMSIGCVDRDGDADLVMLLDGTEVLSFVHEDTPLTGGVAAIEVLAEGDTEVEVVLDRIAASRIGAAE